MKPFVFDIGRASFADGPGIRTVVFLKGCPLRCVWCQNPESQLPDPDDCIQSHYYTPEKLAKLIVRDNVFYKTSKGGVTFSGGEPLLHIDYIHETAVILKKENIHIAVETCGYFDYEKLETALLPFIDLFLFDIKAINPETHEAFTGKSNDLILRNFTKLIEAGKNVTPRIPLIPGYTADESNLRGIAAFLVRHRNEIETVLFLPYNSSGIDKWERMKKKPPAQLSSKPMTLDEERHWRDYFIMTYEKEKAGEN